MSIYFAQCVAPNGTDMGAVKVGWSKKPEQRVKDVPDSQPFNCELLAVCRGDLFEEAAFHAWLEADLIRGEYFYDRAEVRRLIGLCRTGQFPLAIAENHLRSTWITMDGISNFMALHGLDVPALVKLAGGREAFYASRLKQRIPSRRLVGHMVVAALRKGRSVDPDADFLNGEFAVRASEAA